MKIAFVITRGDSIGGAHIHVRDLSLLASVRQLRPSARVLIMTAYYTPEIVAQALELGARGVLSKPFELGELGRRVLGEGAVTV